MLHHKQQTCPHWESREKGGGRERERGGGYTSKRRKGKKECVRVVRLVRLSISKIRNSEQAASSGPLSTRRCAEHIDATPFSPDYCPWTRVPKTLRDRTVTVGALAAHKSNNIDHVFTLPSLRSHHYYVTAQRYIQRRVCTCAHVRTRACRPVVAVGTISGKFAGNARFIE